MVINQVTCNQTFFLVDQETEQQESKPTGRFSLEPKHRSSRGLVLISVSESSGISRARIVRRLKTERVASPLCCSTKIKRAFSQAQGVNEFIQSSNIQ